MRNLNAAARREMARLDEIAERPMPESIRQLTRERPAFAQTQPRALIWPLRCHDGRTWAEVKADSIKEKTL